VAGFLIVRPFGYSPAYSVPKVLKFSLSSESLFRFNRHYSSILFLFRSPFDVRQRDRHSFSLEKRRKSPCETTTTFPDSEELKSRKMKRENAPQGVAGLFLPPHETSGTTFAARRKRGRNALWNLPTDAYELTPARFGRTDAQSLCSKTERTHNSAPNTDPPKFTDLC